MSAKELSFGGNDFDRLRKMVETLRNERRLGANPLVCSAPSVSAYYMTVQAANSDLCSLTPRVGYSVMLVSSHEVIVMPGETGRITLSELRGVELVPLLWCAPPNHGAYA